MKAKEHEVDKFITEEGGAADLWCENEDRMALIIANDSNGITGIHISGDPDRVAPALATAISHDPEFAANVLSAFYLVILKQIKNGNHTTTTIQDPEE